MRNSTIIRKKKKLDCGCFDYAFSKNKCKAHANVESANRRWDEHDEAQGEESFVNLCDDCDTYFSQYVRLRDADEKGIATCFTCGTRAPWRTLQCGHFVPRRDYGTRWHTLNGNAQCKNCNEFLAGNLEVYEQRLEALHPGSVDYLRALAREVVKPTREDLKSLIGELKFKIKIAESKLKK